MAADPTTMPAATTAPLQPQPAITGDAPAGASLEWDLRPGIDVVALWQVIGSIAGPDAVVGLGAPLLDAMRAQVAGYRPLQRLSQGRYTMPATPHALWTFVPGDAPGAVFEVTERLARELGPYLRIAQSASLFSYRQGRDLTGYRDGSANPKGDAVHAAAFMDGEQDAPANASFALVQRWLHFRDRFRGLSDSARDHVIGRSVEADDELPEAPACAHIRRTEQESFSPAAFMFRRSMPWGDGRRHGLQFIAFMNDLAKAEQMLSRMIGAQDGIADAILGHSQAETGAFYYVPPLQGGRLVLPEAQGPGGPAPKPADGISAAEAHGLRLEVDVGRCIHSRNCVLSRPDVFVPNVQGPWLHPELASADELRQLARNCPSGAIQVRPLDGSATEAPPPHPVIRLREHGPLAVHGAFTIAGRAEIRATLCRCGQSANKPYCDGSHAAAKFRASGEADPVDTAVVDAGPGTRSIAIQPIADGPLVVHGPVEIVGGSGQRIGSAPGPTLCRCGHSANKPFCDGSHARVAFRAPA
jgi:Dyp-type peroxidase family